MKQAELPIGVFDSGVGGLTVARAIADLLPGEDMIYLGDTARVPYGTKSPATVRRYALNTASFLVKKGIKLLVVACNTASSVALDDLRRALTIPVIGVIEPGAREAVANTVSGRIAVLGTQATIRSGSYQQAITQLRSDAVVTAVPCPLLVALAEEGWTEGMVPREVVRHYLEPVRDNGFDVLVLGCTHYPLLKGAIVEVVRELAGQVELVDSAKAVARAVVLELEKNGLLHPGRMPYNRRGQDGKSELQIVEPCIGERKFYVTDHPEGFHTVGYRFFGDEIKTVEQVEF